MKLPGLAISSPLTVKILSIDGFPSITASYIEANVATLDTTTPYLLDLSLGLTFFPVVEYTNILSEPEGT